MPVFTLLLSNRLGSEWPMARTVRDGLSHGKPPGIYENLNFPTDATDTADKRRFSFVKKSAFVCGIRDIRGEIQSENKSNSLPSSF
jgi:hypothetical protein